MVHDLIISGAMQVLAGTSGYAYKEWKGNFYPADLPASKFLRYYGERFPTVEANGTFYRMPTAEALAAWLPAVPAAFVFAVKAPQRITHQQRLHQSADSLAALLRATDALGEHLGPLLFQLPPFLKKDVPRLREFLALLPAGKLAAFEFRHPSWFDDEVFSTLREKNAALVISESDTLEAPLVATADWGYLRLRREDYVDADLAQWAEKVRAQPWSRAYVYFKHEDAGIGPKLAASFAALFSA
jgi:uncharacterized protein YecE (DUF72 family)